MIRLNVLYPCEEGARFDWEYYSGKHVPMFKDRLGDAILKMTVEQGLAGPAPDSPPAFSAMAHVTFETLEAFEEAFLPHAGEITADVQNYSSLQPVLQFSEILIDE